MVRTTYFLTVCTDDSFDTDAYAQTARELVEALETILGTPETLHKIVTAEGLSRAITEVEVKQVTHAPESQIVARAVLECEAAQRVQFDKNAFSMAVRDGLAFSVKVNKRVINASELSG